MRYGFVFAKGWFAGQVVPPTDGSGAMRRCVARELVLRTRSVGGKA